MASENEVFGPNHGGSGNGPAEGGAASRDATEEQMSEAAMAERRARADNTIKNHVVVAMSLGLVPVPVFDLALLIGNQIKMVHGLSQLYGVPFKENSVKSIIVALVAGSLPVAGIASLSTGAKLIPGIGSLLGSGGVAVTGGALTYAVGRVFASHFESGGTLLDFKVSKVRGLFKKELERGKAVARGRADPQAGAGGSAG
jgi:uncharacterized protein (DUF697 family)